MNLDDVGDLVRLSLAVLGFVLAVTCGGGVVYAPSWDQRLRFIVLLGYAAIIAGGQLDTLGTPPTWRTWALLPVTVLAVISTSAFLIRHVRRTKAIPDDGRSRSDQRGVFRPRASPRRARRTRDGSGSQGGYPTA